MSGAAIPVAAGTNDDVRDFRYTRSAMSRTISALHRLSTSQTEHRSRHAGILSDASSILNPFPPEEEDPSVAQALAGDWNAVALDAWRALESLHLDAAKKRQPFEAIGSDPLKELGESLKTAEQAAASRESPDPDLGQVLAWIIELLDILESGNAEQRQAILESIK